MNDFVKNNKVHGVYWLKNPIDTITITIKTRYQDGFIPLPTFDQYNKPNISKNNLGDCAIKETSFNWQEKVFSRHEIEKYSSVHNCTTDVELGYFQTLENTQRQGSKIFTYINEDYHRPLPLCKYKETQSGLNSCFDKLSLTKNGKIERVFNNGSGSVTHLFRSNEEIDFETEQWMAMHILYDNSQYTEESQLLLKQEITLISLYHNVSKNYMILSPDTNDLSFTPYTVNSDENGLQYSVEICYGEENNNEELVKMLSKLYTKWAKKQKQLMNFTSPPLGKKRIYMTFEILSAKEFKKDNIYVEFHIKIPDDIKCSGTLHGKTHTACSLETEGVEEWKYGYSADLEMEIATGIEPAPIKIYLEVISTDWWGRHRTEGYTYLSIPLDPGCHSRTLSCVRSEEMDAVEAESRRFFVGGCHLIKDLGIIENPSQSTNYRWRTTGSVDVRWRTLAQSAARGSTLGEGGADAALRRYRRAVATLAAARELYTRETEELHS